jgi:hypothetical protein
VYRRDSESWGAQSLQIFIKHSLANTILTGGVQYSKPVSHSLPRGATRLMSRVADLHRRL